MQPIYQFIFEHFYAFVNTLLCISGCLCVVTAAADVVVVVVVAIVATAACFGFDEKLSKSCADTHV